MVLVTGTWTRSRSCRRLPEPPRMAARGLQHCLDAALATLGDEGRVAVVSVPQDQIEHEALTLARDRGLRAMYAWHLSCALIGSRAGSGRTDD